MVDESSRFLAVDILLIAAFVLELVGIALMLFSWGNRTSAHPGVTFNPKHWKPIWRMKEFYTPRGYWMQLVGGALLAAGAICHLVWSYPTLRNMF
jgi:hypothetical protein